MVFVFVFVRQLEIPLRLLRKLAEWGGCRLGWMAAADVSCYYFGSGAAAIVFPAGLRAPFRKRTRIDNLQLIIDNQGIRN